MGNKKYIESPEVMYSLFEEYKKETKKNPIKVHDFVGKNGDSVYREKEKPLTLVGFYVFCRKNASDVHHYFENTDERYNDFGGICRAIKDEIKLDQIEGGMASIFNPSITQRLNNLVDKQETTVKQEQPLFGNDVGNDD